MRFLVLVAALLVPIAAVAQPAPGAPLVKSRNLGDLPTPATARTNLGLGSIATQSASSIAVTGGTIDGATIGGTTPGGGAFTTLSATGGLQINGAAAVNIIPSTASTPGLVAGPFAGASMPNPLSYGTVALGASALAMETNGGSETVAIGPFTFAEVVGQYGNTGVGQHVGGFDPNISFATMGGNDSGRDAFGLTFSTTWGASTLADGELSGNNTVVGALSLQGNSIGIKLLAGTPVQGDVYQIGFSTSAACGTAPCTTITTSTASYTVPATPTLTAVATAIGNAINALGICYNSPQPSGAPAQCTPITTNVSSDTPGNFYVTLHGPGGATTGMKITMTPSCTGTCTVTATTVGSFTGQGNVVSGFKTMQGHQLTAASYNSLYGDFIAQWATANFNSNDISGNSALNAATNDANDTIHGVLALHTAYNTSGITASGYKVGFAVGVGASNLSLFGQQVGGGVVMTGHDNLLLGTNGQCVTPTAATNNYWAVCAGGAPALWGQFAGTASTSEVVVAGDSVLGNGGVVLATSATTGFTHLPWSSGTPTGVPGYAVGTYGPACQINISTNTLNCYIGSGWQHVTLSAGAG